MPLAQLLWAVLSNRTGCRNRNGVAWMGGVRLPMGCRWWVYWFLIAQYLRSPEVPRSVWEGVGGPWVEADV